MMGIHRQSPMALIIRLLAIICEDFHERRVRYIPKADTSIPLI